MAHITSTFIAVLLCSGESFRYDEIIFGVLPVLAGLLLIVLSPRLAAGTTAIFSSAAKAERRAYVAKITVLYIVLGCLLIPAGAVIFLMFFTMLC